MRRREFLGWITGSITGLLGAGCARKVKYVSKQDKQYTVKFGVGSRAKDIVVVEQHWLLLNRRRSGFIVSKNS